MGPMTDRLAHEKRVLKNGITVFYLPMPNTGIGHAIISLPFGHANNIGDVPLGGFHFLEHCVLNRSEKFPEIDSFGRFVGMEGGYKNGTTGSFDTYYELEIPSVSFSKGFEGLVSHVYNPTFLQEDIDGEKKVIINERKRREPFYPGNSEKTQYINTRIVEKTPSSLFEVFGDDATLSQMTVEKVKKMHEAYFTKDAAVFLGGEIDFDFACSLLEAIPTKEIQRPKEYKSLSWIDPTYQEKSFKENSRYEYSLAYLIDEGSFEFFHAQNILWLFLINSFAGPLYKWLRSEKGWVYELNRQGFSIRNRRASGIAIPLSNYDHVAVVRKELDERIREALSDHTLIQDYVGRTRRARVFSFQTVEACINELHSAYSIYGYPITSSDIDRMLDLEAQPGYLLGIYERLLREGEKGEFVATPKKKNIFLSLQEKIKKLF